jgi:protein-S-isoprenylcysteine O-methyltransferase Ste14
MKLLLKNLLFTLLVPGTVAVWIPLAWSRRWETTPSSLLLALPVFLAGATLYAWTTFNFARIGRGTPAPIDAPRKLIVRGPHRYVRNPMYLGVLTVILGWAVAYRALPLVEYAAAVALVFHLVVLLVEESALRRQFGEEYAAYCRAVRRWLPGRPYRPEG